MKSQLTELEKYAHEHIYIYRTRQRIIWGIVMMCNLKLANRDAGKKGFSAKQEMAFEKFVKQFGKLKFENPDK